MTTESLRGEGHEVMNSFTLDENGSMVVEEITMEDTVEGLRTLQMGVLKGDDTDPSYEYTAKIETSDPSKVKETHLDSKKVTVGNVAVFQMNCFDTSTTFKFTLIGPAEQTGVFVLIY